jgi:chromosome segregation ATPase
MGVPKEDVGVILANVKNQLNKSKHTHESFFRSITTQCASAVAKINSRITSLTNSITDATNSLNTWKKNQGAAIKERKDAQSQMNSARAQLKKLRAQVSKLIMDYKVYAAEADKKIHVVKILRDIINDELYNRLPKLVQVNKFQQKLAELKGLLNNNNDSLYAPIISVLLDLATEQNFADQGVLKKILTNLNNLDKSLKDFRAKQEKSLTDGMKALKASIKNTKQRLAAYRRMRHQALSKEIDAGHYISFYNHEIEHFAAEKGRITDELHLFQKLCAFEKHIHAEAKHSYHVFKTQVVPYLMNQALKLK